MRLPACIAISTELKSSIEASELSLHEALGAPEESGPVLPLERPAMPVNVDGVGEGATIGPVMGCCNGPDWVRGPDAVVEGTFPDSAGAAVPVGCSDPEFNGLELRGADASAPEFRAPELSGAELSGA